MSKHLRTLAAGAAIAMGLAAAPALYAEDDLAMRHDSMMGQGMMSRGMMGQGMMGQGGTMSGMMNMMGMSDDKDDMMDHCNQMMQAMGGDHADRPNDQWRSPEPEQPGRPRG
jgi:hypothetical protein